MKKVVSLLLVVVLALGMATVASAATKLKHQTDYLYSQANGTKGPDADLGDVSPGNTFKFWYDSGTWTVDADDSTYNQNVTKSDISKSSITPQARVSGNLSKYVSYSIQEGTFNSSKCAYYELKFVKPFVSVDEKDVEIYIYNKRGSERYDNTRTGRDYGTTVTATIANPVFTVDTTYDEADTSEGWVAEASENVSNLKFALGNGVYLTMNVVNGKKYYGIADLSISSADEGVLAKYPAIDYVVNLKTVNMRSTGHVVSFDYGSEYYVYDPDLNYLGKASDTVAYFTKYYISNSKLDVVSDDIVPEEPDTVPVPETNDNDNPGTGR